MKLWIGAGSEAGGKVSFNEERLQGSRGVAHDAQDEQAGRQTVEIRQRRPEGCAAADHHRQEERSAAPDTAAV